MVEKQEAHLVLVPGSSCHLNQILLFLDVLVCALAEPITFPYALAIKHYILLPVWILFTESYLLSEDASKCDEDHIVVTDLLFFQRF
jgi:hypothetical protein